MATPYTTTTYRQPKITTPNFLEEYMKKLEGQAEETRVGYEKQEAEVRAIWDEMIKRYQPGGIFQERMEAQLGRRKAVETGQELQHLISAGMYGTSTAGGVGRRWEQEVGAPARLGYEDIMMQRLSQAQIGKAGFVGDIEREYPDVGLIAQLAGMAAQQPSYAPQTTTTYGQTTAAKDITSLPSRAGRPADAAPTGVTGGYGAGPAVGWTGREEGYLPMPQTVVPPGEKPPTGGGGKKITIYSGNPSTTGQPIDATKTINIPANLTPLQAMEKGLVPKGWKVSSVASQSKGSGTTKMSVKPYTYMAKM